MSRVGVVLSNLGGPDTPEAIEPFLFNLFSDPLILSFGPGFFRRFVARRIARKRAPKVAKDYATIAPDGLASPLGRLTEAQARGLEAILERRAPGRFAAAVAMRYWRPTTEDAVHALVKRGCARFLHLPLYPQESEATTESSSRELRRVLGSGSAGGLLDEIRDYHLHPGYVAALRKTVDEGLAALAALGARSPHVLFSAHGLPRRFEKKGDPYVRQIKATRDAVTAGLAVPTSLSFQSRVGPVTWVKPYTDETIARLASEGVKDLLVVPLGFVSDHFETLFEIDRLYGDLARSKGIERFARAPSLNDRPDFLEALADLVLEKGSVTALVYDLVVVGAGITGLSVAWRARRAGRSVLLLEAAPRVGGVIRTDRVGPGGAYRVERAAGTFPSTATALLELHGSLPAPPPIHDPGPSMNGQWILGPRGLLALPRSPPALVRSPILSFSAKVRLFGELLRGPRRARSPESAHGFVRRRFGIDVAERLLRPMTLGIYGTRPEDLGMGDAFPTIVALEREGGSVLRAFIGKMRRAAAARKSASNGAATASPSAKRSILVFKDGMEAFPRAIAAALNDALRTDVSVAALARDGHGGDALVRVTTAEPSTVLARRVVLATTAPEQARLLAPLSSEAAQIVGAVRYVPMVVVAVGLAPGTSPAVPNGFGFLRGAGSRARILGATFASNANPAVAPPGHALLTVFLGGGTDPEAVGLSDDDVRAIVVRDLSHALGGPVRPDLVSVCRWPKAIPVLAPGHRARMATAQRLVEPFGVVLSGSHLTGVGVHACAAATA